MTRDSDETLRRGFRVIRLIAGEPESPWAGSLVCDSAGVTTVLVDADVVGDAWYGWEAQTDGHVLAPLEVMRRQGGHDILLPVCTERVQDFLDRRRAADALLPAGEAVTVAVSLMRGVAELVARTSPTTGSWWLTEAGRPVFATDTAGATADIATVDLLQRLAEHVPELERGLASVHEVITDPRRRERDIAGAEDALFAIAAPVALATTTFSPRWSRHRAVTDPTTSGPTPESTAPAPWPLSLARHLDADWADLVSRTTTAVWRVFRSPQTPGPKRGRPWLVAGCLAGLVVAGGLLWPTGDDAPATAGTAPSPSVAATTDEKTPSPESVDAATGMPDGRIGAPEERTPQETADAPPNEGPDDLATIADRLLTGRTECGEDTVCLADVVEAVEATFAGGVVDLPREERSLTLLDEFGGVAVLRADPLASEEPAQLVVIVRIDDRWLLRDVHDVAEQ